MICSKDLNRKKYETRKRKEREHQRQEDIREREYVRSFKGRY